MRALLLPLTALGLGCTPGLESSGVDLPGEEMVHAFFSQEHEVVVVDEATGESLEFHVFATVISDREDLCEQVEQRGALSELPDVNAVSLFWVGYGDPYDTDVRTTGDLFEVALSVRAGAWWTYGNVLQRAGGETVFSGLPGVPESSIEGSGLVVDIRSVRYGLTGYSTYSADFTLPVKVDLTSGDAVEMDGEVKGTLRGADRCDALSSEVPNTEEPDDDTGDAGDTGA